MQSTVDGYSRGDKMIFVTLGTQDKSFHRLLDEIQKLIEEKVINEEVIVQAGQTKFKSNNMKIFDFVSMEELNKYFETCRLVITHGGVGSIISGLNYNKKVIAVARLAKYVEHENDHQIEIINEFQDKGHILGCLEVSELKKIYKQIEMFTPLPYTSNNTKFCSLIETLIEKH